MIGAILGDIVGSPYEFDNIKTKDFPLFSAQCTFTDDTVMTLAVADALTELGRGEAGVSLLNEAVHATVLEQLKRTVSAPNAYF